MKDYLPRLNGITLNQLFQSVLLVTIIGYVAHLNSPYEEPAENYILSTKLEIPDHIIGEEASTIIIYERDLKKNFTGKFNIEVQILTKNGFVGVQSCNSPIIPYRTDKVLPQPVELGWFKGEGSADFKGYCSWINPRTKSFSEGQYRLCLIHEVITEVGSKFTKELCSNIYRKIKYSNAPSYLR